MTANGFHLARCGVAGLATDREMTHLRGAATKYKTVESSGLYLIEHGVKTAATRTIFSGHKEFAIADIKRRDSWWPENIALVAAVFTPCSMR